MRDLSSKLALLALLLLGGVGMGVAMGQGGDPKAVGRIGPDTRIQPSGRVLKPIGKQTKLGNLPAGGALTTNGRFLWTLSAGRGDNDIRIVEVGPRRGICERKKSRRSRLICIRKRNKRVGRVVTTIPMPGVTGGIVMSPDNRTAYVSGSPESGHRDQKVEDDVPGQEGDVIHVFRYNGVTGRASRDGVIEVPPPDEAPMVQAFPPSTDKRSWPRDLAVSRDGKTLLAALNLADHAAVIDTESRRVRYVKIGGYPYGAAITRDGKRGLVSNEADGTVSVIDLESAEKIKDIRVGPNLSHPEGMTIDPRQDRAYVTVTHQDLVAVIDTKTLEVERMLSVERPEGIGTAPNHVSTTGDGRRLLVSNSGEDAVAVFALPQPRDTAAERRRRRARARGASAQADRVLQAEGRRGVDYAETAEEEAAELEGEEAEEKAEAAKRRRPVTKRPKAFELIGRIPVGSYPVGAFATPLDRKLVWLSAKGLGVGPNDGRGGRPGTPGVFPEDPGSATAGAPDAFRFAYLPSNVFGSSGILRFPTDRGLRKLTPRASRQVRPLNDQKPPPGTPITAPGPGQKIEHVFYIVRENRTYDQILGDDPRGDGDPKLTLFPKNITPNAHALAERFPLLDHVYANSEASIDGHFWTSAAAVSDYVVKNWHQNYGDRERPYDFGVYSVTWPSQRFLFDQAEKQGISYFNYGEAIAGTVPLADRNRSDKDTQEVVAKFQKSDLGPLNPGPPVPPPGSCFSNDASSGGRNVITMQEVYDSSRPPGVNPANTESRFECFQQRFRQQLAQTGVPKFNYITLPNDHTVGTTPGGRSPKAMIAENDLALGEFVEEISKSPIWSKSLIMVIEDDSQDGADHVDAHRIPAFVISPYAKRGAVVHTRYDFLSFIRTLEITIGMKPLNLFDATAVPMYDAFDPDPSNAEPYEAITPDQNLTERNGPRSTGAKLSSSLPLQSPDRVGQRILDKILWQSVHGPGSAPPPPGPNAAGVDGVLSGPASGGEQEEAEEALEEEEE